MLGLELQQRWQPGVGVKARPCGVEVLTPPQPSGTISRPSMTSWAAAIASREKQMDIFGGDPGIKRLKEMVIGINKLTLPDQGGNTKWNIRTRYEHPHQDERRS